MPKKLVVVAHGIGDHKEDFFEAWIPHLEAAAPGQDFEVVGLHWDDVLDEVASHYDLVNERMADVVAKFGFTKLKELLDDENYKLIREHLMDVLVYCGLDDMRHYVQSTCILRLKKLTERRAKHSILIGHSLGAAMLPHLTQMEYQATGAIPYHGLILLSSPLGMESPVPSLFPDPLRATPRSKGKSRNEILGDISFSWSQVGAERLHFVINTNDIVCADVQFEVGGQKIDLIPIPQGFTDKEIKALELDNPGCVVKFTEGKPRPQDIVKNHAVELYLQRQEFKGVFKKMIEG
jgi:hypothetical protein